jgi:hypothetical protein
MQIHKQPILHIQVLGVVYGPNGAISPHHASYLTRRSCELHDLLFNVGRVKRNEGYPLV